MLILVSTHPRFSFSPLYQVSAAPACLQSITCSCEHSLLLALLLSPPLSPTQALPWQSSNQMPLTGLQLQDLRSLAGCSMNLVSRARALCACMNVCVRVYVFVNGWELSQILWETRMSACPVCLHAGLVQLFNLTTTQPQQVTRSMSWWVASQPSLSYTHPSLQ